MKKLKQEHQEKEANLHSKVEAKKIELKEHQTSMKMQMSKFKDDNKEKKDKIDQLNKNLISKQEEHETMMATIDKLQDDLQDKRRMLDEIQN